jgi:hypothetical protein
MTNKEDEAATAIVQCFGHLAAVRIGLSAEVRHRSVMALMSGDGVI